MSEYDKLIFELSVPGRVGYSLPEADVPEADPARPPPAPPPFYPLGSCTMKYNPKVNEDMARLPGFARLHPLTPDEAMPGALELMVRLGDMLAEIVGMEAVSIQPAGG